MTVVDSPVPTARDRAIDRFRGLAILLMVIANFLEHVSTVPGWLKHAPDVGLTVVDFIAPAFIFAIGLTFPGSARTLMRPCGVGTLPFAQSSLPSRGAMRAAA